MSDTYLYLTFHCIWSILIHNWISVILLTYNTHCLPLNIDELCVGTSLGIGLRIGYIFTYFLLFIITNIITFINIVDFSSTSLSENKICLITLGTEFNTKMNIENYVERKTDFVRWWLLPEPQIGNRKECRF